MSTNVLVSIPFKRDGLSEPVDEPPKNSGVMKVSIPFKREGLSEPFAITQNIQQEMMEFQFPSNGMVFPNLLVIYRYVVVLMFLVSIPFKRDGLSELES